MIQEPELEEGETCYYKDDASMDPDVALSYIGDRVQSILGHLQKDFEGSVSAENLGAKFGAYGSFLPTHQRSPSIWSQPKSPLRVQNTHLPRSLNVCPEGPAPNSVKASTRRDDPSSSPNMPASQTLKAPSDGASIGKKATLSSGKVAKGKVELPSSKSSTPLDHRTLKVRIKVGPERVAQYNAQIYSLGLTSPSSSEGNSHDESDGLLLESYDIPKESPAYMLKIMTSFPVPGELLLSPLREELLNLAREREYSVESEFEAAPKNSATSVKLLNNDVVGRKKPKFIDKSGDFEKSEDNFVEDLNDCEQKTLGANIMECSMPPFHDLNCKSLPDTVRDPEKDVVVSKRRGSKDSVKRRAISNASIKDTSLEHTSYQSYGKYEQPESRCSSAEKIEEHRARMSQKDASVDHGQDSRSEGKGNRPSFKARSDHSEGEAVKNAIDDSILKVGPNSSSSEHNGFDPHAVGRLSYEGGKKLKGSQSSGKKASKTDSLRDGDCDAPKNKFSGRNDVHRHHLNQKDVVPRSLEHIENSKRLLERSSDDMPKDFNFDDVEAKSVHVDKMKERSSAKKYFDRVSSDTHIVEPPAAAIQSKEGLEHTVAAPVVIEENWVQCDRCETWRLLPYGTKSEQLPEKWVCSMQEWLPGMNRCDVSEDDTTKAIQALYLVPVPEHQHNFQAHAGRTMAGAISASAHEFGQNNQNPASDQMKKQKLKEKQNTLSVSYALPSNGKKQIQGQSVKNGSSKEEKLSLAGVNTTNKSNVQHPNKSATVSAKLSKRKGEHVIGDDPHPRKKIKKESGEQIHGKGEMKGIKSNDALAGRNFENSPGNLGMIGRTVTSDLPSNAAVKNGKKKTAKKNEISGEPGNIQIYVKQHKDIMQDVPDNGSLGMETCNGREVTAKKIKLKDYAYSQHHVETLQNNGSSLQDRKVSANEDCKDGEFHRDKKPRVSQIEEESRRSQGQGNDKSNGKSAEARVRSSGSKEYSKNRSSEKEHQVGKTRAKPRLTVEDIDKLRKDLGCEQLSTAATSSSSKVSDSRKNRLSYVELKGSPEESVSSSPMRMLYPNQVSPMMMETAGKVDFMFNDVGAVGSAKKFQEMNESSELGTARKGTSGLTIDNGSEILDSKNKLKKQTAIDENHHASKDEVSSDRRHPLSYESGLKSSKNSTSIGKNNLRKSNDKQSMKREHDKIDTKSSYLRSRDVMQQNHKRDLPRSSLGQSPAQMEPWSGKVRIDLRQGDKQGAMCLSKHASGSMGSLRRSPMDSGPHGASALGDTSKAVKGTANACLPDGTDKYIGNEAEQSVALDASCGNKNVSGITASSALKEAEDVLKEAEELRTRADLIKNSGFSSESNYGYFKAGLKFLHGASLLEAYNGELSKHLETSPMQVYGAAAQLCKTCANEYEKSHELAAAALAYKCMEVAYLRVVYCKSSTTSRVWQDLHSSMQMIPQGESPSSSASDVDNLNNLAMTDKATLSKGSGSHAGNHVIVPRNRPNFVRLLDFTKDVNSAMEAAKKSQDMFAASHIELEESQNKNAIISVKRVIDFSFQDVEELVRLVGLAFNTINHQGPRGNRE